MVSLLSLYRAARQRESRSLIVDGKSSRCCRSAALEMLETLGQTTRAMGAAISANTVASSCRSCAVTVSASSISCVTLRTEATASFDELAELNVPPFMRNKEIVGE